MSPLQYRPTAAVLVSHLRDEAVLLHLGTKSYFRLNATGAFIWKMLEAQSEVAKIAPALVDMFEVTLPEAHIEVEALITALLGSTLIEPLPSA
ncbi:MAG: hypothetical protein JWM95_2806 [Gemmatimonadetes bacterium]|nr:hypothetical protein [Gemmatimonadota bacterium]